MYKEKLFNRDFTLLALGQAFSLVGNYALKIALSMYVLELTGSAAVFAGMLALAMVPTILLSPFGGILADRCDRRKLMAAMDAASGAAVLLSVPAVRYLGGTLPAGALLVVLSVLGAFESPTVQACVPQLLSGDNILRGNSVVSQIQALAGLVTPFLGSLMYAALGLETVLLAAGLAGKRLKKRELLITCFGLSLLLAGAAFMLPLGAVACYIALTAAFCVGQLVCTMFSVLALSEIQQRTPEGLTGKVMALTITFSMCAQPLGQVAYGALFDWAGTAAQLVLLPTGTAVCVLGLAAARRRE